MLIKIITIEGKTGSTISGILENGGKNIGECRLYTNNTHKKWTVCAWYIRDVSLRGKGYGKEILRETLQKALKNYGMPEEIYYIWDGTNDYVIEWLGRKFDARCTCPIAVQKSTTEDDWTAHIYNINPQKIRSFIMETPFPSHGIRVISDNLS